MHGNGVKSRRPTISPKVIKELQPAKRFKPHIVERALTRLRADLVRDGVVKGGSPLNDRTPAAPDDNQQPSAVPSPSAST